jgi:RecA-family ATPase
VFDLTELRLALVAHGQQPIPCRIDKRPTIDEWQHCAATTREDMANWSGPNTGMHTAYSPTFDSDVLDPAMASRIEEVIRDWYDSKGEILVRVGKAPKFAIPFKTASPFPKKTVLFKSPHGDDHRIEILGDGQQIIVHGPYLSGGDYTWHNNRTPWNVPRGELPEMTEADAGDLLKHIMDVLTEEFGVVRVDPNGGGGPGDFDEAGQGPVDVEAELLALERGRNANLVQRRIVPSMLRKGMDPYEVWDFVVDETMKRVGNRLGWTRAKEVVCVRRRIMCGYNNVLLDWYTPDQGVPDWLPYTGDYRARWAETLARGGTPRMHYAGGKFCVTSHPGPKSGKKGADKNTGAGDESAPKRFVLLPFEPFDLASLPPREWLYGRHYQRCTVSATVAPGGFGKTTLCMVEGVAMATARNLLGEQPLSRLRVWFHNGEDSREELKRRLGAICLHYDIPLEELRGWFFMTSGNEVPLKVANGYGELRIDNVLVQCIEEEVSRNEIDVAILDPLVTLHGVSEQDNNKMDALVRIFAAIADAQDCAIELSHHTRKLATGTTDYSADDMRGASAIKDAVRAARMLNHMTAKDAEAVSVPEHERTGYFRIDRVKGNNAPPCKAVWRRFVNVELPNTDEVGVVISWDYPGQGTPSAEMTAADRKAEDVFIALLMRFTREGRTVSASAKGNYAPTLFSKEREAKDTQVSKAALIEAMRRLFEAKRIRVEQEEGRHRGGRLILVS